MFENQTDYLIHERIVDDLESLNDLLESDVDLASQKGTANLLLDLLELIRAKELELREQAVQTDLFDLKHLRLFLKKQFNQDLTEDTSDSSASLISQTEISAVSSDAKSKLNIDQDIVQTVLDEFDLSMAAEMIKLMLSSKSELETHKKQHMKINPARLTLSQLKISEAVGDLWSRGFLYGNE